MALFLETVHSISVSTKYNGLSLTECLCEGIQLTQEMMDLQEAVFRADFILHQKNQGLNEGVQTLNEAGFLSSVWEKTKSMLKKVWEWIKATWNKLVAKVTEWANRIGDRLAGNTKEIKKSTIKKAELMESYATKLLGIITKLADTAASAKSKEDIEDKAKDLESDVNEVKTEMEEAMTEANKLEGRQTVSATFAKKVADVAKRISVIVKQNITKLENLEKVVTKQLLELKDDSNNAIATKNKSGEIVASDNLDDSDTKTVELSKFKIDVIKTCSTALKLITTMLSSNTVSITNDLSINEDKIVLGDN